MHWQRKELEHALSSAQRKLQDKVSTLEASLNDAHGLAEAELALRLIEEQRRTRAEERLNDLQQEIAARGHCHAVNVEERPEAQQVCCCLTLSSSHSCMRPNACWLFMQRTRRTRAASFDDDIKETDSEHLLLRFSGTIWHAPRWHTVDVCPLCMHCDGIPLMHSGRSQALLMAKHQRGRLRWSDEGARELETCVERLQGDVTSLRALHRVKEAAHEQQVHELETASSCYHVSPGGMRSVRG